ncbi:radical SAM protein [Helicobacter muridarum]|uniref:Probable dual-specificity RNA methyltransferase RlmN n=2 Tax=Helicobacter muridarum TaxID=216 RepID=A0A377PUN6_9HELI|nr:23S rRNA (adenine(2503)-C(2))-methyltransferase RlmN [Helicobacter muridarum]STQ86122.1 radical SAM protein [Helicobacter muridarum]
MNEAILSSNKEQIVNSKCSSKSYNNLCNQVSITQDINPVDIKIPNSLNIQSTNLKGNDKQHIYCLFPEEILQVLDMGIESLKSNHRQFITKKQNSALGFRSKQIYSWLYSKYTTSFDVMSNISKADRYRLNSIFSISNLNIKHIEQSSDGTKKYLFQTGDNLFFESVLILMKDRVVDDCGKVLKSEKYTFCLSSQIGCKIGCTFCSTAKGGFVRNLTSGEIVEQVVFLKRDNGLDSNKSVNIVFMGMGEPLDNLNNVVRAIKIISHKDGLNIATRRQTISTSGIVPQIAKLADMNLDVQIALSLHAVDDSLRDRLMPINKSWNIAQVLESLRNFPIRSRNKILFEYLMLHNVNDSLDHAKKLVSLLNGFRAKVNLIPFNPHSESEFERPSRERLKLFADYLYKKGIVATIRESRGLDISAACGQLRQKVINGGTLQNKPTNI